MFTCEDVIKKMYVNIPDDVDALGDNSPLASKAINKTTPSSWSWAKYTYKKQPLCASQIKFIQPGFAKDINGQWQVRMQSSILHKSPD